MAQTLCLSLGEFFAEVSLKAGDDIRSARWPLSKTPLLKGLQSFFAENPSDSISEIQINLPVLESLLRRRLGNPPAFLTTEGFENWLEMNLPVEPQHFSLYPRRVRSPLDTDLTFGISERLSAKGEVLKAFDSQEIDFLVSKLQMNEVKWIALGLLHADKNPAHENQIKSLLEEKGFNVVPSSRFLSDAERPRWWAAVLTAYVAPMVEEWRGEIAKNFEALEISAPIKYWSSQGLISDWTADESLKLLFGSPYIIKNWCQKHYYKTCLFLDLEGFYLQSCGSTGVWQSDAGPVAIDVPHWKKLRTQPTSPLLGAWLGGVEIGGNELGFEPGPMSLGRGLIPCFIDALNFKYPSLDVLGFNEYQNEKAKTRYDEALSTLARNFSAEYWDDKEEVSNSVCELGIKEVLREIIYVSDGEFSMVGGMTPWFSQYLKSSGLQKSLPPIKANTGLLTQLALQGQA